MGQRKTKEFVIRIYSSDPVFACENLTDLPNFKQVIQKNVKFGYFLSVKRFVQSSKDNVLYVTVCDYDTESFYMTLSQLDNAISEEKNHPKIFFFIQSDYPDIIQREYNIQYHIYTLLILYEIIHMMDLDDVYETIRNFYMHNLDPQNLLLFLRNDGISIRTYKKIDMGLSKSLEDICNKFY